MFLRVRKLAVEGSPMSSTCATMRWKKLGGGFSGMASTEASNIPGSSSGRDFLMVADKLFKKREGKREHELIFSGKEFAECI